MSTALTGGGTVDLRRKTDEHALYTTVELIGFPGPLAAPEFL